MGQAPATRTISLRTVPRNFPGRSGTKEDQVCLVSPETAAASALNGRITDPRTLDQPAPSIREPEAPLIPQPGLFIPPLSEKEAEGVALVKGPNISDFPEFEGLPDILRVPVLLKVGDNLSTDEILPAGTRVLPYRSNIPKISQFTFADVAPDYHKTAMDVRASGGHAVIGGENYGQGSSREHAVLAPRFLGLRFVLVKSFARIHWQNLVNFGVLPLCFENDADYERLEQGDSLQLTEMGRQLREGQHISVENTTRSETYKTRHSLSERQVQVLLAGGRVNQVGASIREE
jgi:aconitate hydratase